MIISEPNMTWWHNSCDIHPGVKDDIIHVTSIMESNMTWRCRSSDIYHGVKYDFMTSFQWYPPWSQRLLNDTIPLTCIRKSKMTSFQWHPSWSQIWHHSSDIHHGVKMTWWHISVCVTYYVLYVPLMVRVAWVDRIM